MNSMDMYNPQEGLVIKISDKIIEKIKNLKSSLSYESGYTPNGVMLQWRYSDNKDIIKDTDELEKIQTAMQFIFMLGEMTDEFRKKHNVEHHHEQLIKNLYIDIDTDSDGSYITTAFKRPFGNSHVAGDVAEKMAETSNLFNKKEYYPYINEDEYEVDEELVTKEYLKFIDILDAFTKDFQMKWRTFESNPRYGIKNPISNRDVFPWEKYINVGNMTLHRYLDSWKIHKSELRSEVIDKILD